MMALFIVRWLLSTSAKVQKAVGGYFKDPTGSSKNVGTDMAGTGENFVVSKDKHAGAKRAVTKGYSRGFQIRQTSEQHRHDGDK
jgi:hypothetical protein